MDAAEDWGDTYQRRLEMPLTDGVQKPVRRRHKRAEPHHVPDDRIDAQLHADQVSRCIPPPSRAATAN